MGKRKVTYQSKAKPRVTLTLTGRVFLMYRDDEAALAAAKGDLLVYPSCNALHTIRQGDYEGMGHAGYFKADICDGREWRPLLAAPLFPHRENHFSKRERPIDAFSLCLEILRGCAGREVTRTYREHYEFIEEKE